MKTPEEFAEAMKGKETFALKGAPAGEFTVSTTKKKGPPNFWWPDVTDAEEADRASKMGSGAAIFIAGVNAIIATISIIIGKPVLGVDASGYLDSALFALVAWGIRCKSRYAALAGLGLFVLEKSYQFITQPKSMAGLTMAMVLLFSFISGVRGTRAYWRFEPEKAAAQAEPFLSLWKTPAMWVTLLLAALSTFILGLNWLHNIQALVHRTAGGPAVMTGNPVFYALSVVVLVSAAASVFAIVRRPRWGRTICALFASSFAVYLLCCLALRGPSGVGSAAVAWLVSLSVLAIYVYATCVGQGARVYFSPATGDAEVFKDRWPGDKPL